MTEPVIEKPIPEADDASKPFYEGGMAGRLMMMKCSSCGTWRLPSRSHCDECLSDQYTWEQASGRGVIRTFGVMHQKYHPGFFPELPYNVTIVELEEGPRVVTNIVGAPNSELRVGLPVVVQFEKHADSAIPKFRPV
ncbi:MAG: OB-fold domain-containing protein [Dehalococcoidia bacterium]|nr:OB-fold domain-containing protein [Dehalococcoidia bacterium]